MSGFVRVWLTYLEINFGVGPTGFRAGRRLIQKYEPVQTSKMRYGKGDMMRRLPCLLELIQDRGVRDRLCDCGRVCLQDFELFVL